jgi:hypothetical protein
VDAIPPEVADAIDLVHDRLAFRGHALEKVDECEGAARQGIAELILATRDPWRRSPRMGGSDPAFVPFAVPATRDDMRRLIRWVWWRFTPRGARARAATGGDAAVSAAAMATDRMVLKHERTH